MDKLCSVPCSRTKVLQYPVEGVEVMVVVVDGGLKEGDRRRRTFQCD